jgi:hypothetical protein
VLRQQALQPAQDPLWDRNGYCLLYKRLHRALFRIPPGEVRSASALRLSGAQLAELIAGVARETRKGA